MELLNPILHRELRQGLLGRRFMVTQWFFVAAMALVVWVAWPRETKLQVKQIELAQQLFQLFSAGLYLAVSALAAAFGAMAITREKETGSFELLCTTGLSVSQLLWGKFLSVIGFLLLLVVSSVPITMVCYLMGGVEWNEIGMQYLHVVLAVVLFGWIGVTCSSFCERNQHALSVAFVVTLPLALWSIGSARARLWIEGIVTLCLLTALDQVAERVRRPREEHAPPLTPGSSIVITMDTNSVLDRILLPKREQKPFSDRQNPVYERELVEENEAESRTWWHFLLRFNIGLAVLITLVLFFGRFWLEGTVSSSAQFDRKLDHFAGAAQLLLFAYWILVALLIGPAQSANAFTKERERRTADLLLTTLLRPWQIILGKWRLAIKTSFHYLLLLLLPLIPVLVLIWFGKRASIDALIVQAGAGVLLVFATLVTLNTLGVFFSLVCKTSAQSLSVTLAVAVGWLVGPVLLYYVLTRFSELPPVTYAWTTHVSPFPSFFTLSGSGFFAQAMYSVHPLALAAEYLGLTVAVNFGLFLAMATGFNRAWKRV